MTDRPISEILNDADKQEKAIHIDDRDYARKSSGSSELLPIVEQPYRKSTYNDNNGVYNIYDETGRLFITTDAELIDKIAESHRELKKDDSMGVYFSNGENLVSSNPDASDSFNKQLSEKWQGIKRYGSSKTQQYLKEKNATLDAKQEMLQKLSLLRGTAKETPTAPTEKREINSQLRDKILESKMRS